MDAKRKVFVVLGAAAVIGTAAFGGGALFFSGSSSGLAGQTSSQTTTSQPVASSASSAQTQSVSSSYKDGTYTASSSYFVPHGGDNSVKTSLTIANGTVTNVSVNDNYSDGTSADFVDWFEQEVQSAVVGKSLADLSPSRIGGASLTTQAFDQTLDTIRSDAKA